MKKAFASIVTALIIVGLGATPARADDRATQFGATDKSTPSGMSPNWDITEVQVGIESDDNFLIFLSTKRGLANLPYSGPAAFTLYLDTDLDKKIDYTVSSTGELSNSEGKIRQFIRKDGTALPDCDVYVRPTVAMDSFYWSFPKPCLFLRSTMNIYMESTPDGISIDRYPDGSKWWNIKTDFFKAEPCASYMKNDKRTYKDKTYLCTNSAGKWSWKNYGPIAASKSKYKTEKAFYICNLGNKAGALLEDSGRTLTLDGAYKYIITERDFNCVTSAMGVPASVLRKIAMTRALDGTLDARWSNINAFWNYHPDSGLNITFSYN